MTGNGGGFHGRFISAMSFMSRIRIIRLGCNSMFFFNDFVATGQRTSAATSTPTVKKHLLRKTNLFISSYNPCGQRPDSTYINASFIEGYHNDESFIITQDPMPSTVEDFWRMVTEHNICTMVQLNALPAAKENDSPAINNSGFHYWHESDTSGSQISYGSLQVTLKTKEAMPSYVKREFVIYNSKVEEEVNLTHFAYSGWGDAPQRPRSPNPGQGSPEVPKATTGLLDLVEHALAHKVEASLPGPIAVHCRYGSERSSVFVSLSCLVQQIKTENRSDVFTTVRKLRSQRQGT